MNYIKKEGATTMTSITWNKLDPAEQDHFNPNGYDPHYSTHGAIARDSNNVRWDLTVLRADNGKHLAAHGGIILPEQHSTIESAKARAEHWFNNERQGATT